jgi:hypothetical protein
MLNPTPAYISNFIRDQFPEFYREINGPIVDFVLAYYEWLEQEGQNTKELRGLRHARDIDSNVDKFTENFKNMFMAGAPLDTRSDSRFILKHISDLYQSKGSSRSIELLIKLLYDEEVSVFLPSKNILIPSNTRWTKPEYIELSFSDKSKTFPGTVITGGSTGATGFCESVIEKTVQKRKITIAYISNVKGTFSTGEIITNDDILDGSPVMTGSLSNIDVINGGRDNSIGDIFDIVGVNGRGAQAKVTKVENLAGRVNFNLANGGYGYTVSNTYTDSLSSNVTLIVTAPTNSNTDIDNFFAFETVSQPIQSITITGLGANVSDKISNVTNFFIHATNNSVVNSFNIFAGGINYTNTDTIEFTTGDAAASISTDSNGSITSITIDTAGSGYTDPPGFNILSANGTGATLSVVMGNDNYIQGANSTDTNVCSGYVVANSITSNTTDAIGNLTVIITSGDFADVTYMHTGNVSQNALSSGVANVVSTGQFIGYTFNQVANTYKIGINANTDVFYAGPGTFIVGSDSNTFANVTVRGFYTSGADFEIGGIGEQESLTFYSDIIGANNTQNVAFINVSIEGQNANIGVVESITVDTELSISGLSNTVYFAHQSNGSFNAGDYIYHANVYVNSVFIAAQGSAYDNTDTITLSGNATATLVTTNTGGIAAIDVTAAGADYPGQATVTVNTTTGSGANVYAMMGAGGLGAQAYIKTQNATDIVIYDESNGSFTTGDIITNRSVNAFANVTATQQLGGNNYSPGDTITINGGDPANTATATLNIQSNAIASIEVTNPGSGYDTSPTVTITTASGINANLTINMDFGAGFEKSPQADDTTILNDAFSFFTANVGEIISLSGINPGAGYSLSPITAVRNRYVAAFNRRDLIARVSNVVGFFQGGERLTQSVDLPGYDIVYSGISNTIAIIVGEGVKQDITLATGIVESVNSTVINLKDTVGVFNDSNDIITLTTNATVTPASSGVSQSNGISIASGRFKSITLNEDGTSDIKIRRMSFGQAFVEGSKINGISSGANADIIFVQQDDDSLPIGFNASITANVQTANGVATEVEIINSGYGYSQNNTVNLVKANSEFISTGTVSVTKQGVGPGRWLSSESFLNDVAKVQDSDYYQEYSYVVKTGIALDKYSEILKEMLHVAGFRLFGEVNKTTEITALNVDVSHQGDDDQAAGIVTQNAYSSWMN